MTRYAVHAEESAVWALQDARGRARLAGTSADGVSPLESSARAMRLALGERYCGSDVAQGDAMSDHVTALVASGSIPEVLADELDLDTVRRGVLGNGALVVRGLLDTEAVSRLVGVTEAALRDLAAGVRSSCYDPIGAMARGRDRAGLRHFVESSGGLLVADSPRGLETLLEEYRRCGVLDLVEQYIEGRALLSGEKTTFRAITPSVSAELGWHQDGAFLGSDLRALNVWVALTDCGVDAPSMMMVPRRLDRIVRTGGHDSAFDWSVGVSALAGAVEGFDPVVLEMAAGDAVIFDEMNLHRTYTAPSMKRTRLAVESWFFSAERMPVGWAALAV